MSATMPSAAISCPRTQKSRGRPLGRTAQCIRETILGDLVDRYDRMTVRQVFYALEVLGVVAKTNGGYRQVQNQVLQMRKQEILPWGFITDGTRWRRKPESWDSAQDYLGDMARGYRRDLWRRQNIRIEVWLEKDALADVILDVTAKWDVPLMVSRGQSSATFLYNAAQVAKRHHEATEAETVVYTLYDHDAGGVRAERTIFEELPRLAGDADVSVRQLAVRPSQIREWNLPTRPPKKTDPQAKEWGNRPAVELDAIPPDRLQQLVEDAIVENIVPHEWEVEQAIEAEEKAMLLNLCRGLNGEAAR